MEQFCREWSRKQWVIEVCQIKINRKVAIYSKGAGPQSVDKKKERLLLSGVNIIEFLRRRKQPSHYIKINIENGEVIIFASCNNGVEKIGLRLNEVHVDRIVNDFLEDLHKRS